MYIEVSNYIIREAIVFLLIDDLHTPLSNKNYLPFICIPSIGLWLGLDVGDGQVEASITPSTLEDLSEFNVKFNDKIRKEICDKHIWFSLVLRPQWSPFTRLQRLSCCLSFLFTTMIASAMFYGAGPQPGDTSGNFQVGPLTMNMRTLIIAIQSALVVAPVNIIIVACFRFSTDMPEKLEEDRDKVKRCLPSCTCRPCRDGNAHDFKEKSTGQARKVGLKNGGKRSAHVQDDVLEEEDKPPSEVTMQNTIDQEHEHEHEHDESKVTEKPFKDIDNDDEEEEKDSKCKCCTCCSCLKSFR